MHFVVAFTGEALFEAATGTRKWEPGFTPEQAEKAVRMEVWGTEHNEGKSDYCDFKLFDINGKVFATKRVENY